MVDWRNGIQALQSTPLNRLWLFILACIAVVLHAGTAFLRLGTFWPQPKLLDFASFYAGATVIRTGESPYQWDPVRLDSLRDYTDIGFTAPISTPAWLWLLSPFSWLPFLFASVLWLALLAAIAVYCAFLLAQIAGYDSWFARSAVLLLVVTFGPTMLNLTLGQNGLFLLLAVLMAGQNLVRPRRWNEAATAISWTIAIAAKLFPILWVPAFALLQRWRMLVVVSLAFAFLALLSHLLSPEASGDYWLRFLPGQVTEYADTGALDDQSLSAWLDRMGRSRQFSVSGLSVSERHQIDWHAPWESDPLFLEILAIGILLILGTVIIITVIQAGKAVPDAALFLWVMYCLLLVPHTERYNHVLLLPAMAWIWSRGGQSYVIVAYFLVGVARLTHLWVILLPAPFAPLLSGSGILAVLLLIGYSVALMRQEVDTNL